MYKSIFYDTFKFNYSVQFSVLSTEQIKLSKVFMGKTTNPKKKIRKILIIVGTILCIIAGGVYLIQNSKTIDATQQKSTKPYTVETKNVRSSLYLDGNVEPKNVSTVYSDETGKITSVRINEGNHVSKGDIIVMVDVTDQYGDVDSESVKATSSGVVTELFVDDEQNIMDGQTPIATISDMTNFQIVSYVNEYDINKISTNNTVKLIFDAIDDNEVDGKISKIFNYIDKMSQMTEYKVLLDTSEYPEGVKSGMSVSIEIVLEEKKDVIAIGDLYIYTEEVDGHDKNNNNNQFYVNKLVKNDGHNETEIKKTAVSIGLEGDTYVEITEGLKEGDKLVLPTEKFEGTSDFKFRPMMGNGKGVK